MPPKTNGFWMFTMATMKGMSPEEAKRQAAVMWDSMGEEKREEWKQKARAERAREKGILADPSDRFVHPKVYSMKQLHAFWQVVNLCTESLGITKEYGYTEYESKFGFLATLRESQRPRKPLPKFRDLS